MSNYEVPIAVVIVEEMSSTGATIVNVERILCTINRSWVQDLVTWSEGWSVMRVVAELFGFMSH